MTPLMIALLLLAAPTPAAPSAPLHDYFPPQTATYDCRYGDRVHTMPLVDESWLRSYVTLLSRAGESSLLTPRTDGAVVVRFTWTRSFHAPVIIRLTLPRRGDAQVEMIRFSGLGGYDYGRVMDREKRSVTRDEAMTILTGVDPKLLVPPAPRCGPPGLDGAHWLIERSEAGGLHFAERWSPTEGVVRDTGMALIRLAGLEGEEIY